MRARWAASGPATVLLVLALAIAPLRAPAAEAQAPPGQPGQPAPLGQPGQLGQLGQPGQLGQLAQPAQPGQLGQPGQPAPLGQPAPPGVAAAAGILIDAADGKILWEKQAGQRRPPASLTKTLTALIALQKTRPSQVITASSRAEAIGSDDPLVTELELVAGEKLTSEQLLYGLLLPSANDAAVALAEGISGSLPKFAALMNQTARALGARDTHFVNPSGFDDPRHYSTARDLALIARAAMANPVFRKIVATPAYALSRPGRPVAELRNRNALLGSYEGANGIKTGQTRQAGKALIASARRGGEERIAVVLDSPDPAAESAALLDYGFEGFRRFQVARTGRAWGVVTFGNGSTATLVARSDLSLLLEVSAPDPGVTYLPRDKVVEAAGVKVPVTLRCRAPACGTNNSRGRIAGALMYLFSPILSLLK